VVTRTLLSCYVIRSLPACLPYYTYLQTIQSARLWWGEIDIACEVFFTKYVERGYVRRWLNGSSCFCEHIKRCAAVVTVSSLKGVSVCPVSDATEVTNNLPGPWCRLTRSTCQLCPVSDGRFTDTVNSALYQTVALLIRSALPCIRRSPNWYGQLCPVSDGRLTDTVNSALYQTVTLLIRSTLPCIRRSPYWYGQHCPVPDGHLNFHILKLPVAQPLFNSVYCCCHKSQPPVYIRSRKNSSDCRHMKVLPPMTAFWVWTAWGVVSWHRRFGGHVSVLALSLWIYNVRILFGHPAALVDNFSAVNEPTGSSNG
jgi:hypothetical protein